jgi:hypothetical protein
MRPFPAVVRAVRWLASLPLHLCPALRAPIASVRYTVVLPVIVPVLPVPVDTGNTDHKCSTCACVNNSEQEQQQQQK